MQSALVLQAGSCGSYGGALGRDGSGLGWLEVAPLCNGPCPVSNGVAGPDVRPCLSGAGSLG